MKSIKYPYNRVPRKLKKHIKKRFSTDNITVNFSFVEGIAYYLVSKKK